MSIERIILERRFDQIHCDLKGLRLKLTKINNQLSDSSEDSSPYPPKELLRLNDLAKDLRAMERFYMRDSNAINKRLSEIALESSLNRRNSFIFDEYVLDIDSLAIIRNSINHGYPSINIGRVIAQEKSMSAPKDIADAARYFAFGNQLGKSNLDLGKIVGEQVNKVDFTNTVLGGFKLRRDPSEEMLKEGVEAILEERENSHGDYQSMSRITQELKSIIRSGDSYLNCNNAEREALDMILLKVSRIVSGNPHFQDHWDDIAGYSTLVSKEISKEKK